MYSSQFFTKNVSTNLTEYKFELQAKSEKLLISDEKHSTLQKSFNLAIKNPNCYVRITVDISNKDYVALRPIKIFDVSLR